jgi:hypothetical protein
MKQLSFQSFHGATPQVIVLCHRTAQNLVRNPFLFWGHLAYGVFIGGMTHHAMAPSP